jgi:hypothetical protein
VDDVASERFDHDESITNPATWNLIRLAIKHTSDDRRGGHEKLEPECRDYRYFASEGVGG